MKVSGHSLIVGVTMAGKTTLVKRLAGHFSNAGTPVIVLTAFKHDPWPADFVTDDPDEFMRVVFNHTRCLVIVDEAGEYAGQYDKTMMTLATRGRHNGHLCMFIAQRANMINRNIRVNCRNLFLFRSSKQDCELLANDFVADGLEGGSKLNDGECLAFLGNGDPVKINVFD